MRPELFRIAYGSTHLTIYMPDLEALHIPLPPVQEQHRIVAFLDEQVGTLERAASAHSRILSLRNERIDALVSRFLASTVYDAPDRTSLVPMKRILSKIVTPTSWSPGGVVTAFRDGQVTARSQRRAEGYTEASSENSLAQEVKRGDLVIHGLDGFAGAIGTSESDGVCSPAYHVCRVNNGDSDFYGRLLRLMAINGYLSLYGGSSRERAVDFRNWGSFSRTPIPVVLREEQERIGDMIRSLRPLSAKVSHLQSLINERKQALITLAVTGQLDVTTARAVA
jgi:type I restriction enzyme S subunit